MDIEKLKAHIIRLRQVGGGSTTLSVDDVECLINEREEAVAKLSCAELEISLLKEGKTVLHNLSEENCVLRAKLDDKERIIKEWQDLWMPIDDFVRPLSALGECVSMKALEMIKEYSEIKTRLAAMESQRFNVKEFIRRCQDQWDFDVKIASKMLEIAKYVPTVPADKPAARPTDDDLWDQTISDRDTYHEWADKLANAISEYFGSDIGEHTSANNPWAEALDAIECADTPARITEQDAYDIILNFFWFMESYKHKNAKNPSVVEWYDSEGRDLLNKLNADREQVPTFDLTCDNFLSMLSGAIPIPDNITNEDEFYDWCKSLPDEQVSVVAAPDAEAAFELFLDNIGGADSYAWHDYPAADVFVKGFEAGLAAAQSHNQKGVEE